MRQTVVIATTALVTAIVASWATVIIAQSPKSPNAATVSSSVDVMRLMKDAKNLSDEKADPVD